MSEILILLIVFSILKYLCLSNNARQKISPTKFDSLISIHAGHVYDHLPWLNDIWYHPLRILVGIYFIWSYLGIASFVGFSVLVFIIPLNIYLNKIIEQHAASQSNIQSARISLLTEIVSSIKMIKLYGWEYSFCLKSVNALRHLEMSYLTRQKVAHILCRSLSSLCHLALITLSFGTFIYLNEKSKFTLNIAFITSPILYMIKESIERIGVVFSQMTTLWNSFEKLEEFLLDNDDECENVNVTHVDLGSICVKLSNIDLSWNDVTFLRNICLEIEKGKLIALVGSVGAGKSSLIAAILGEMNKLNDGSINVNGSLAYVSQQAWIQNRTLRENILFGNEYDQTIYERVIDACCLRHDIEMMSLGDLTMVGERGCNLSGGQKQRISLARAVYSNRDIYLLDDVLSSVDANVSKCIFEKVIGHNGILKTKVFLKCLGLIKSLFVPV